MLNSIKTTVENLDTYKQIDRPDEFQYFTVRDGKAKYHIIHLPDNSCGLYYAFRIGENGQLRYRRALEAGTEITCWMKPKDKLDRCPTCKSKSGFKLTYTLRGYGEEIRNYRGEVLDAKKSEAHDVDKFVNCIDCNCRIPIDKVIND